jgi:membrane fusion protein (multidrug efflux system)
LNAGDKVIIDNIIKLRPGAVVAPNIAGEKPEGAPAPNAKEAGPEKSSGLLSTKQA